MRIWMRVALGMAAATLAAPALAQDTAADATEEDAKLDQVVCKRFDVTGSLAQKKKICATRREWAKAERKQDRDAKEWTDRMRQPGFATEATAGAGGP